MRPLTALTWHAYTYDNNSSSRHAKPKSAAFVGLYICARCLDFLYSSNYSILSSRSSHRCIGGVTRETSTPAFRTLRGSTNNCSFLHQLSTIRSLAAPPDHISRSGQHSRTTAEASCRFCKHSAVCLCPSGSQATANMRLLELNALTGRGASY